VVAQYDRTHVRLGNVRLGVALICGGAGLVRLSAERRSRAGGLAAPGAVFVALAMYHERVLRARALAGRAVAFYQRGLGRLEHKWMGQGEAATAFANESHPYASDLDLFGAADCSS